ncbi:MAG: hypothetical protein [Bacteriophage sp.]|jgi:hypothetical protein|nr:MAG: hypothetical protein [Bacteriophage sp.]
MTRRLLKSIWLHIANAVTTDPFTERIKNSEAVKILRTRRTYKNEEETV